MIHHATTTHEHHRGQGDYATATISRAPTHVRATINRARAARGLPIVLGQVEALELEAEVARARRAAADAALARGHRGGRPPASPPARGLVKPASRATTTTTRVLITAAGGIGRFDGQALAEITQRGAYGTAAAINARGGWCLVDGHHGGEPIARAGRQLRVLSTDHPLATMLIEWLPNMADPTHRRVLERIESGATTVSLRALHHDTAIQRIPRAAKVVRRASLVHVALLDRGRQGAYPGALCRTFRHRPDTIDELTRQINAITTSSSRRAAAAGWGPAW
jgi:hypothetical protein